MTIAGHRTGGVCCRQFTLVELIAVLILGGILLAVAGIGLANVAHGFERARISGETAQKAQLAITRITKELTAGATVTAPTATSIAFTSPRYPGGQSIALNGTNLLFGLDDVLVDGVSSFNVAVVTGPPTSVTLTLRLTGTGNVTYAATVYP